MKETMEKNCPSSIFVAIIHSSVSLSLPLSLSLSPSLSLSYILYSKNEREREKFCLNEVDDGDWHVQFFSLSLPLASKLEPYNRHNEYVTPNGKLRFRDNSKQKLFLLLLYSFYSLSLSPFGSELDSFFSIIPERLKLRRKR